MSKKSAVIRSSGPDGYALVDGNGRVIRDGFRSAALAAMWGTRKGHYRPAARKPKRDIPIPDAVANERIFGLPFYANLQNRPYPNFLVEAKRGEWGTLIRLTERTYGIRLGDYRQRVAEREIKIPAE